MKITRLIVPLVLSLTILLTACAVDEPTIQEAEKESEQPQANLNEGTKEEAESVFPITIEHAFGETRIEQKPERVATISTGNQDVPLALGIRPVGISKATYGVQDESGLLPWTQEAIKALDVDSPMLFDDATGLNYEAISESDPDVILAAYSGITQEQYDILSEIAPVVAYPKEPWQTYWRDQIIMDAKGMGMEDEGEALVGDLETLIAEKAEMSPPLQDKTVAVLRFVPSDLGAFYVALPIDPRVDYLVDLGMVVPDSVIQMSQESTSFALEISAENVDRLSDVDVIITFGTEGLLESLQGDPLIGTLPAIMQGSVVVIEEGSPLAASTTPTALSIPATIDTYISVIAEVITGASNEVVEE